MEEGGEGCQPHFPQQSSSVRFELRAPDRWILDVMLQVPPLLVGREHGLELGESAGIRLGQAGDSASR